MSDEQAGSPDHNDSRIHNGDGRTESGLPGGAEPVAQDRNADGKRADASLAMTVTKTQKEIGGRGGLQPTRYGDWEIKGRCIDF